ncbi:MAG: ParB/RepB/Spo0J family partition protein [Phycisphaerales bacterium]
MDEREETGVLVRIDVERLTPGRFQPRREMDEASLHGLAESIKASGVMQPLAVRALASASDGAPRYEIVAGERRWRAAKLAGLAHVPAVVTTLSDREAAEWAMVENLQREDLNAMERAWGLRNLVEAFALGHAEVAARIGLDRSSVSNMIRLTELEASIQALLRNGELGIGHGKALLSAPPGVGREKLATLSAGQKWSVRRLERAVGALSVQAELGNASPTLGGNGSPAVTKIGGSAGGDPLRADAAIRELERQLGEHLGTKVRIATGASRTKGRIMIEFFSVEHFDGLMGQMGVVISS